MKKRVVFFVRQGLDNFLTDIINGISDEYETRKVIVTNYNQINSGMQWADICWFEWCDELIIYGSKLKLAEEKKIICRLHRYEAFTNYIKEVNWNNVDKVVFVSEHIRDVVIGKINLLKNKSNVIYNGINLNKFIYHERKKGFNLAWIGYLNLRKNPMLVIQYFNELVKINNKYKLFIAGSFQDEALYYYLREIINRLKLNGNIQFDGFISNDKMSDWLNDKNYIVTGSIAEGHPVGIMEAMASGLKPVIHYFPGADKFYKDSYIYYDFKKFIKIIVEDEYDSKEYRDFIENKYSLNTQIRKIKNLLSGLVNQCIIKNFQFKNEIELYKEQIEKSKKLEGKLIYSHNNHKCSITVVTPFYNYTIFMKDIFESIKNQSISEQIEWILVDDMSSDDGVKECLKLSNKYKDFIGSIKIYSLTQNFGATSALKFGFSKSSTKYTAWISADDLYISNDKLEFDLKLLNSGKYDVIYSNKILIGGSVQNAVLSNIDKSIVNIISLDNALLKIALFVYYNKINGSSLVFNNEKYNMCGGFDNLLINVDGDLDILTRAFLCNLKFTNDDKVVFNKIHENQTSRKKEKMLVGASISRMRILNILKEYNMMDKFIKYMKLINFYNERNFKIRPIFSYFMIKSNEEISGDEEQKFINYVEQNYNKDMLNEIMILSKKMMESTAFKKFKKNMDID